MKLKKLLLALKIGFLLAIFGAATFYFQYTALKNAYMVFSTNKQATEKTTGSLPLAEEETKTQNSSMEEEEERSDDRAIHELTIDFSRVALSVITPSTSHLLSFKEIHFEVITPPPQA